MNVLEYFKKKIEGDSELKKIYEKKSYENLLMNVGNEVLQGRIKNKIQQKELAKKLKTSQSYISRLENGSLSPSLKKLQKISELFGGFVNISIQYKDNRASNSNTKSCYFEYKPVLKEINFSNTVKSKIKVCVIKSTNQVLTS